jgi:hypothetical protein
MPRKRGTTTQQVVKGAKFKAIGGHNSPEAEQPRRFDTFLCHSFEDKALVKRIGRQLRRNGVSPWLDEWELRPGIPWQRSLEEECLRIPSAVIFIGSSGVRPWQRLEYEAFLREFVRRGCAVVPVILPNAPTIPDLPVFLKGMTWVDFRRKHPNPLRQLLWSRVTGRFRSQ